MGIFGRKVRDISGNRVGSIAVLIAEFTKISNEFKLIEQNMQTLSGLSAQQMNAFKSASPILQSPMGAAFGNIFKNRETQLSQIYYAAQNDQTYASINQIHSYVENLVNWLNSVSNSNPEQLHTLFGNGPGNHGSFYTTFSQLSQKIDEINKKVGVTLNYDKIAISNETVLKRIFDKIPVILQDLEQAKSNQPRPVPLPEVLSAYEQLIKQNLTTVLNQTKDLQDQLRIVNSHAFMNQFVCREFIYVIATQSKKQDYINIFTSLIGGLANNNLNSIEDAKKYVMRNNWGVTPQSSQAAVNPQNNTENQENNSETTQQNLENNSNDGNQQTQTAQPTEQTPTVAAGAQFVDSDEYNKILEHITKLGTGFGNPSLKSSTIIKIRSFVENKENIDDAFKNKLNVFVEAVSKEIIQRTTQSSDFETYNAKVQLLISKFDRVDFTDLNGARQFVLNTN